jgi:hypothetical protein
VEDENIVRETNLDLMAKESFHFHKREEVT